MSYIQPELFDQQRRETRTIAGACRLVTSRTVVRLTTIASPPDVRLTQPGSLSSHPCQSNEGSKRCGSRGLPCQRALALSVFVVGISRAAHKQQAGRSWAPVPIGGQLSISFLADRQQLLTIMLQFTQLTSSCTQCMLNSSVTFPGEKK